MHVCIYYIYIYIYICTRMYIYIQLARTRLYIRTCTCIRVYIRRRMSQMESGKLVSIGIRLIMVPHRRCMNSWRGGCCNTPCHARLSYRRQHCYQRHASIGTTGLYRNTISLICPSRLSHLHRKKFLPRINRGYKALDRFDWRKISRPRRGVRGESQGKNCLVKIACSKIHDLRFLPTF